MGIWDHLAVVGSACLYGCSLLGSLEGQEGRAMVHWTQQAALGEDDGSLPLLPGAGGGGERGQRAD